MRVENGHFQLLRNIKALSPFEILFAVDKGIGYYNTKNQERKIITREPNSRFILTTYDVKNDLVCMGSYDGKIYLYSLSKEKYVQRAFEIAQPAFEDQIVNCIKFVSQSDMITSCNDSTVKLWDLEVMKHKINLNFKDPINIAELSPDGNLLGVYGDCLQAEILDFRNGKVVATLHGHTDFGFSMAWHPNGMMLATGN